MKYSTEKLKLLESWLSKKIDSLENNSDNTEEYNEINLSKNVLEFIQYLVSCEVDKVSWYEQFTHPHVALPPQAPNPFSHEEMVCAVCKAKDPTLKYCIHRIVY